MNKKVEKIYHYCSDEVLNLILTNKTLRLSDIRKSSDKDEIDYLYNCYKDWLEKLNNGINKNIKESLEAMERDKNFLKEYIFLVSCFTKKSDDEYMWENYAPTGVRIEFDKVKLRAYMYRFKEIIEQKSPLTGINRLVRNKPITVWNVKYSKYDLVLKSFYTKKMYKFDEHKDKFLSSPTLKKDEFKPEKEVRIIYYYKIYSEAFLSTKENPKKEKEIFYPKEINGKMTIDIPLPKHIPTVIKSIRIGPGSNFRIPDVRDLLEINGIDPTNIQISYSKFRKNKNKAAKTGD